MVNNKADNSYISDEAIKKLTKMAKAGNEKAFEQIVTLYEKQVFNLAMYIMQNHEDALDVSQEVFLKLYQNLSEFREESSLKTYIMVLTKNAALDEKRKKSKRQWISLNSENENGEESKIEIKDDTEDSNPEKSYLKKEKIEIVRKAIKELNIDHRKIIILRDINGLSYAEISEILDISEGTVKSRINRARTELKNILEKWNYF